MKRLNNSGFTIIETMLVLAITGLLVAGVMIGVSSSINAQRYRDSVVSLQSILQRQYLDVVNVVNDGSIGNCVGVSNRGQSDCIVLGRYITNNGNSEIKIQNVYAKNMPLSSSDDMTMISSPLVSYSASDYEMYSVEWGALLNNISKTNINFSVLIIRLPISGTVRTFIDNTNSNANIKDMILSTLPASPLKICLNPNGMNGGAISAVQINVNSANASGVETIGDGVSGC